MADELHTPTHRLYERRNNIALARNQLSRDVIYDSGIQRLDAWINANPWGNPVPALFATSEPGVWLDPSDLTTMFQDTAGTIPVTTPGQSVARINDKSGRGNNATQSTAASRPTYGVHPIAGVRNVAQGSADVGNATYWPSASVNNGVTATKLASGIDTDGLPYLDVRYQGTSTATFHAAVYETGQGRAPAAVGQTFTASVLIRRIGGSEANLGPLTIGVVEETAPSSFVNQNTSAGTLSASETLTAVSRTIVSGNQVRPIFVLNFAPGAAIDVTFRIKGLQLELGSSRTAYQFNYNRFNVVEPPFAQVHYLSFDGVDDFLVTPTVTPGIDKVQVFAGVRKLRDNAIGAIVEHSSSTALNNGSFLLALISGSPSYWQFLSKGTVGGGTAGGAAVSPETSILTGLGDIGGDTTVFRRNGALVQTSIVDQGPVNYLSYPIFIGRRNGTEIPFNGNIYSLITRFGPNLTAAQITETEAWVNSKTGAY